jgi:REP-associated tyrosine transposase
MNSVLRPARFVPFDESGVMRIYERNLPHWRQDGCTYFVTFRLADSVPVAVRKQWEQEKSQWLQGHGIAYDGERGRWRDAFHRLPPPERFRFEQHFNRQVQSCLDRGLGECHLGVSACVSKMREELLRGDDCRYHLGDFVIMPNHVHLLITPVADNAVVERNSFRPPTIVVERNSFRSPAQAQPKKLELILKSIKGASAVACNRLCDRTGTFWQADSYDHIVRTLEQLAAYREYITRNPALAHVELPTEALYRADWMDAWLLASS